MRIQTRYFLALMGVLLPCILAYALFLEHTTSRLASESLDAVGQELEQELVESVRGDAEVLIRSYDETLINPLLLREHGEISVLLEGLVVQNGILEGYVFDRNDQLIADEGSRHHSDVDSLEAILGDEDVFGDESLFLENDTSLLVARQIDIDGYHLGTIVLVVDLAEARESIFKVRSSILRIGREGHREQHRFILLITFSLLVMAVLVSWFAARSITSPIRLLRKATRRIAEHERPRDLPLMRSDEIGDLARDLLAMFGDLTSTTVSRDYLESILSSMEDGVVVTEGDGTIRSCNDGFKLMVGGNGDLVGTRLSRLLDLHQERLERFLDRVAEGSFSGKIEVGVYPLECAGTEECVALPVSLSAGRLRSSSGGHDGFVFVMHDISTRKELENKLLHSSLHDSLTGLLNRKGLLMELESEYEKARLAEDYAFALIFIDLDRFKVINDTRGHQHGDMVLRTVGKQIGRQIRDKDAVGRIGGDEFVVVVHNLEHASAADRVAKRILTAVQAARDPDGNDLHLSCSVGITYSWEHAVTAEEMLGNADLAMYSAKTEGKGRICYFESRMRSVKDEELQLESDLRKAMGKDEIELHYQPIMRSQDDRLYGFEALARWTHPRLGTVSPARFISMAEQTGLIVELGWYLLERAFRDKVAFNQMVGHGDLSVSINVSPLQIVESDFVQDFFKLFDRYSLNPEEFVIEITESAIMGNPVLAKDVLEGFRSRLFSLSMDDFGTGYSSLSHLNQFPFESLKIDREFINGIAGDSHAQRIVKAVVGLADSLGLEVVAEGVEFVDDLEFVKSISCHCYQGYIVSRPMSFGAASAFLARHGIGK